MKKYVLITGFGPDSSINRDIDVALRFESMIQHNASSTRNMIANGIKHVWVIETHLNIDEIVEDIMYRVKEDSNFRDLKMTSMEYFEIKTNKVIL